ncbi:hypothetical protein BDR03DRAFT_188150 [Suillus americanus]|nr:hypothetical protein BDR03DRAFT_188150 [Suillus americanus]
MRFSLVAVITALTAFMSVSATQPTPAVFSRDCTVDGGICEEDSECCSKFCLTSSTIRVLGDEDYTVTNAGRLAHYDCWANFTAA